MLHAYIDKTQTGQGSTNSPFLHYSKIVICINQIYKNMGYQNKRQAHRQAYKQQHRELINE